MDSYNYSVMAELKEKLKSYDISYFGTLSINETDIVTDKDIPNTYDIYVSIEKKQPENENKLEYIYKFYNRDGILLAIDFNDGKGILSTAEFVDVLSRDNLEQLNNFLYSQENSFNQIDMNLEKISKACGVPKKEILAIAETHEISKDSIEKPENDEKIHLKNKNKNVKDQNPKSKAKIKALEKQSTDLNQNINANQTLGDILGIPQGGKLVAVYSDSIENGKNNNTRFTFLLKDNDENYSEIPNIEQAGGINPNTDVAQSNENGDTVKKGNVNSIYKIKGTGNIEYLLTANIGSHGTIELGIGQRDKTQGINESNLVTTPLKTTSTYYTNKETREAINSSYSGNYQPTNRSNEAAKHDDKKCSITVDEVDGKKETGHQHHLESSYYANIADEILNNNSLISEVYNRNDVIVTLQSVESENPNLSEERLIELVTEIMQEHAKDELNFGHIFGPRSHEN